MNSKLYTIIHLLIICLSAVNAILVFVWTNVYLGGFATSEDPLHHFNYHPVLAVVGLVLYGEGLLMFRNLHYKSKGVLKFLHSGTMFVVFILLVISLNCVFNSHNKRKVPIPNLYSLHSWIGFGAVALFSIQFVFGFLSFVYPGLHSIYRRTLMPYHRFIGINIFVLFVLSVHSGIMEKLKASLNKTYMELPPAALVANFLGVFVVVHAGLIVFLASMPEFKRLPLPEENKLQLEMSGSFA